MLNPDTTLALLIGVDTYDDPAIHKLPAAKNNVGEFRDVLVHQLRLKTSPNIPVINAPSAAKLLTAIGQAIDNFKVKQKLETLLFYYAGHGYVRDRQKFYLSVKETLLDEPHTGVSVDELYGKLKVEQAVDCWLIFDACYSGMAIQQIPLKNNRIYAMASAAFNREAKYPQDKDLSDFTRELASTIRMGINNGRPRLTLQDIQANIAARLHDTAPPENRGNYGSQDVCINKRCVPDELYTLFSVDMATYEDKLLEKMIRVCNEILDDIAPDYAQEAVEKKRQVICKYLPPNISDFLNKIFKNQLLDYRVYLEWYGQTLRFLTYAVIKDLADREKLTQGEINQTKDVSELEHFELTRLLETLLDNHRTFDFFFESLRGVSSQPLRDTIKAINSKLTDFEQDQTNNQFRLAVLKLVLDLSFFAKYKYYAIRYIGVSKPYPEDKIKYLHEVNDLSREDGRYRTRISYYNSCLHENTIIIADRKTPLAQLPETRSINLWPLVVDGKGLRRRGQGFPYHNESAEIYLYALQKRDSSDLFPYYYKSVRLSAKQDENDMTPFGEIYPTFADEEDTSLRDSFNAFFNRLYGNK